jgi:hypothetical protein
VTIRAFRVKFLLFSETVSRKHQKKVDSWIVLLVIRRSVNLLSSCERLLGDFLVIFASRLRVLHDLVIVHGQIAAGNDSETRFRKCSTGESYRNCVFCQHQNLILSSAFRGKTCLKINSFVDRWFTDVLPCCPGDTHTRFQPTFSHSLRLRPNVFDLHHRRQLSIFTVSQRASSGQFRAQLEQ